ncbi:hypothetical protein [Clavibacter tessellarius]|uniref:hypothetical protein n=1 Tax=Clavibacter tessellarius TaxID=31965 RepID=UPI0032547501
MEFSIAYPPELPVSRMRDEIADAIRDNQVVIVAGATGSGKTTQLPKICLEARPREHRPHAAPQARRAHHLGAHRGGASAARSASSSATRCASPTRSPPTPASS